MAETALDVIGRTTALRKVCGYPYPRGACDGRVEAVSAHVGICDGCSAVWYVARKGRYQARRAEMLRLGGVDGIWPAAIHELVRELADRQRTIDDLLAAQRLRDLGQ